MRALVVYESLFDNTHAIADAVADGLRAAMQVDVVEAGVAPSEIPADVNLVIVGGPTHAFRFSRLAPWRVASTNTGGRSGSGPIIAHPGVRDWLDGLGPARPGLIGAAFDTRADRPRLPGGAAIAADLRLRRHGVRIVSPPQSFYVARATGPLVSREAERAREWARWIVAELHDPAPRDR